MIASVTRFKALLPRVSQQARVSQINHKKRLKLNTLWPLPLGATLQVASSIAWGLLLVGPQLGFPVPVCPVFVVSVVPPCILHKLSLKRFGGTAGLPPANDNGSGSSTFQGAVGCCSASATEVAPRRFCGSAAAGRQSGAQDEDF
jgi:hypothetical protein